MRKRNRGQGGGRRRADRATPPPGRCGPVCIYGKRTENLSFGALALAGADRPVVRAGNGRLAAVHGDIVLDGNGDANPLGYRDGAGRPAGIGHAVHHRVPLAGHLTGTGYFDLMAYARFNDGEMQNTIPTDEQLAESLAKLPKVDK